ncbi:MAG TPA: aldo/keto reductase [Acidimicrobiales bacterium]|nr:aldo/keto reductase [Acidimicrobiales bacterium]
MDQRQLGSSGVELPVIGFGCGPNARLMVGDDEDLRIETIAFAIDQGITYFDTAYAYGWGASETNLGRALAQLGASPSISTKFCLQPEDLKDPRSAVLKGFEENLARLGLDRVDVLLSHNRIAFEHEDGEIMNVGALLNLREVFGKNGVASALQELMDAKVIRTTGFTSYGGDPGAISEALESGVFGSINASFSLLNPSAGVAMPDGYTGEDYQQVIATAQQYGVGVMAIQVLGRGILATEETTEESIKRIRAFAEAHNESLVSTAIRYVISKPGVSTAILGLSEPKHVQDAVDAVARGYYNEAEMNELEAAALS